MLRRRLTPLEELDLRRLSGRGTRLWLEILYWAVVVTLGTRLFIALPEESWGRFTQWMTVLGVYIFFLTPPFASFHTIARRAKEGTLTSERLIPVPAGIFLLGKIKVMALTGLKLSWPVFLLAWIGDPTLRFSSKYLMLSFYLMPTPGIISPIVLFLIGIFFLLVFWMCLASIVVRVAFEGKSLAELLGRYIFWGLIILLALGWAVSALVPVRTAIFPGFGGMVLTASAVFLGFAFLIFRESLRWLESGE